MTVPYPEFSPRGSWSTAPASPAASAASAATRWAGLGLGGENLEDSPKIWSSKTWLKKKKTGFLQIFKKKQLIQDV